MGRNRHPLHDVNVEPHHLRVWHGAREKPADQYQWDRENREDEHCKKRQKEPVAPGMDAGRFEMPRHERVVSSVRFPRDVERVAEKWDSADDDLNGDVGNHTHESDVGQTAVPCGEDEDAGCEAAEDVAEAGDEANDSVEAETDFCAGNTEPVVEHVRDEIEVLVVEGVAAFAREQMREDATARRQYLRLCGGALG